MTRVAFAAAMLAAAGLPAWGRIMVVHRLASPPLPVEAGQQFSVCAANVGTARLDIELQFVSVRTGAIVAAREIALPPPGMGGMPDPCLSTTADTVMAAGNPPAGEQVLLVAVMVVRRGLFSRPTPAATAAVQVTAQDPGGSRRLVASVPLHLATMTNNRNTPLETVR